MSTSEIVECSFRKVSFPSCGGFVMMAFGKVDMKSFIEVVWKDAAEKEALLKAVPVVAKETEAIAHSLWPVEKTMYCFDFPSLKFNAFLESCFVKAKVPKSVLYEKQNNSLWKAIEQKAALTKITSECDRLKYQIDEAEKFLREHFDEFVSEYPEYQRAARYLRNFQRTKRRKIEKE